MIPMKNWASKAVKKLSGEKKAVTGQKEKIMAGAVFEAVKDFCIQDEEFSQAVVQGGSFADCMKQVATGVGNSISDLDAYKKAVQFYFPGAEVKMQLTIDLIGSAAAEERPEKIPEKKPEPAPKRSNVISLNLEDFF